jgi:sulfite reductase beta subunit-like hemoprotein
MPRKFKTSFSGDAQDSAVVGCHGLGFVAALQNVNGETIRGFKQNPGCEPSRSRPAG